MQDLHASPYGPRQWHGPPIVALVAAAVCLAVLNFLSQAAVVEEFLAPRLAASAVGDEWKSAYWVASRVLCYFLLPAIVIRASGGRLRDHGLAARNPLPHAQTYVLLLLGMLPIIVALSFSETFQRYYPFYDYAGETLEGLLLWELLYAVQFLALEFFYRGFLLFSLQPYLGVYAIFVMMIPYCMVHFGKPFVETFAAIPAGIILGGLALRTRSILPGALLHVGVAWTMDLLSLAQRGALPQLLAGF